MTKNKKLLSLTSVLLIICLALGAVLLTSSLLGFSSNTDITNPNNNSVPTAYTPISEAEVVKDGRVSSTYSAEANKENLYPDHTLVAISDASQLTTEVVSNASNYIYLTDNITVTSIAILGDFGGVFDGNGKTVSMDITADTNTWYSGGFVNTLSGAIINTTFNVVKYSNGVGNGSDSYHGVIAYQLAASAIIDNIYVDLIYSPTAVGVNTAGPYIWTKTMHTGGGTKAVYLSGIAGQALAGSTIRNSTVNNDASNAGFYATTWISNGHGWLNQTTYTNTYVSAFIGKSEGATMSNITYTGSGATTVSADSGNKKENTAHIFGIVGNAKESSVTINGLNYAYTGAFTNGAGITTGNKSQQAMFVREGTLAIANIYVAENVGYTSKVGIYNGSGKLSAVQYNSDDVELVDMAGDDTIFKVKGNADNSPVWTISNNGAEVEGAYTDLYKLQAGEYAYVKSPLNLANVGAITTDTPTMYYVQKISGTNSTYSVGDSYNATESKFEASKYYDGQIPSGGITFADETSLANIEYYESLDTSANVGTYVYTLKEDVKANFNSENVLFDTENRIVFRNADFNINANLEWTVTPRPVTLNVDNKDIVYGDELNNDIFTVSSIGELDPIGVVSLNAILVANGDVSYTTTTAAGDTFAVTAEVEISDGNDNYDITLNQGTLTVIKRDVAINSTIASRDYDNTAITQAYEYAEGVIVNGYDAILEVKVEWLQNDQVIDAPTNAGDYTLRYTFSDNGEIANYNEAVISYDFSINKRAIDIDYSPTQGKWYTDGLPQTADYTVSGINDEDTAIINELTSIAYYTSLEHTDSIDTSLPGTYYAVVTFAGADNYLASSYEITMVVSKINLIAELMVDDSVVFTYGDDKDVSASTEVFIMSEGNGSYNNINESDIYSFYTTMTEGALNIMGNSVGDYSIYIAIKDEYKNIFELAEIEFAGNFSIIPADATITLNAEGKTSHTALDNIASIDFNSYFVSAGVNSETPEMAITFIGADNIEVNEITTAGYYTVKASLNDSNYNAVSNEEYTFFVAQGYQEYIEGDIKFELSLDKFTISTIKTKTFISVNGEEFVSLAQPLVIDITAQAAYTFEVRMDIDYDLSLEGIDVFEVTYTLNETDVLTLINGFDLNNVKVSHLSTMEKVFTYAELLTEASADFNEAYTALQNARQNKINAINSAISDVVDSAAGIIAQGEEA